MFRSIRYSRVATQESGIVCLYNKAVMHNIDQLRTVNVPKTCIFNRIFKAYHPNDARNILYPINGNLTSRAGQIYIYGSADMGLSEELCETSKMLKFSSACNVPKSATVSFKNKCRQIPTIWWGKQSSASAPCKQWLSTRTQNHRMRYKCGI